MEMPGSQESQEILIQKFVQAVELEFSKQNSTPSPPRWSDIQPLMTQLKTFIDITINEKNQKIFIEYLLQYVELVISFVSSYDNMEYRKQRQYGLNCLSFIPGIFKQIEFKNLFVEEATAKILDLFMYGNFNLVSKKDLLSLYNEIAGQSKKKVRIAVSENTEYYMYKLLDHLSTHGDFVIQSDIMETLFRIFGNQIRNNIVSYQLLPGSEDLGKALVTDISSNEFDADVRRWLNKFNQDSPYIFSISCKKVMFGNFVCPPPEELDKMWVDFNLKENMVSFYCDNLSGGSWNRITIIAKDVKKIEVNRPLGANESTVSILLSKACFSEQPEGQEFWDRQEKNLKLFISNENKDQINKLITTVLPQVFGDTFSHTSAKIAVKPRQVYKPLGIKVSKKKSCVSDASSITSASKTKSDSASVIEVKISRIISESGETPTGKDNRGSPVEVRHSRVKSLSAVRNDISISNITDFTRYSDIGDRSSMNTSNRSDIFGTSKTPSTVSFQKKVQDNIVTSSHEPDNNLSPRIEILSGQCSGRSTDYQAMIHAAIEFQASDVFASSPYKMSKPKDSQDTGSELFRSAESFSEDEKCIKDTSENQKNSKHSKDKISCLKSQEELLEEEFETAAEYFEGKNCQDDDNNSDLKKGQQTVSDRADERTKISKCVDSVTKSDEAKEDLSNVVAKKSAAVDGAQKASELAKIDQSKKLDLNNENNHQWRSRLRNRASKKNENEHIEEIVSDDSSDRNREIVTKTHKDRPIDKLVGGKDLLQTDKQDAAEVSKEINTDSTTPDIKNISQERVENIPILLPDQNDAGEQAVMNHEAFFTEDVFTCDTQKMGKTDGRAEVLQEIASESIFSRETQENIVVAVQKDQNTEEFTDWSLGVNVGVSDNQLSEDLDRIEKHVLKESKKVTEKHINTNVKENDYSKGEIKGVFDSKKRSKSKGKENIKDIIDLTQEEDIAEDVFKIKFKWQSKKVQKMDTMKNDANKVNTKDKPMLNTPELLDILDEEGPLIESLQEIYKESRKEPDKVIEPSETRKADKGDVTEKHADVLEKKTKKKNKRPKITTSKKRFVLEEAENEQITQDDLVIKETELPKKHGDVEGNIEKPDTYLPGEEIVESTANTEPYSEKTNREADSEPLNQETNEVVSQKDKEKEMNDLTFDSEKVAPPINTGTNKYVDACDKLRVTEDKEKLSGFVLKKVARPLLDSQSDSPLKEEMKHLVVTLTKLDQVKQPEEKQDGSCFFQKDTGIVSIGSAESHTVNQKQSKDSRTDSEGEIAPTVNSDIANYNDEFNKLKDTEDDDRLSGFILKKPTKPLVGTQDAIEDEKLASKITDPERIADTDTVKITKRDDLLKKQKKPDKISKIVGKGKKGKRKKQLKKETSEPVIDNNNAQQESVTQSSMEVLIGVKEINEPNDQHLITDNTKANHAVVTTNPNATKDKSDDDKINEQANINEAEDINHNKSSSRTDLNGAACITEDLELFEKGSFEEKENISDVEVSRRIIAKETVQLSNKNKGNENLGQISEPKTPSVTSAGRLQGAPVVIFERNEELFHRLSDSSPEAVLHSKTEIVTIADVHLFNDDATNNATVAEVDGVRKSKRVIEKKITNYDSVSEELHKLENEISQEKERDRLKRKSPIIDFDQIDQVVEDVPIFKRTRNSTRTGKQSPDGFDELVAERNKSNKSNLNMTAGNRSRKLYNPGDLTYLNEMPAIAEQETPDLDVTPIPMVKGTKLPKKKRTPAKKRQGTPKSEKKTKSVEKSGTKSKPFPEKPTQSRPRTGKKKEFTFTSKDFRPLDYIFHQAHKDLASKSFAFDYRNRGYGGLNNTSLYRTMDNLAGGFNHTLLNRPIDIAVRSAPVHSSSDESPPGATSMLDKKKTSPELPKTLGVSSSPHSTEYSWPELDVEPVQKIAKQPKNKIKILHNILIKPKRASTDAFKENETSVKRKKLDLEEPLQHVPLPSLPDDMPLIDSRSLGKINLPEEQKDEVFLNVVLKCSDLIGTIARRRPEPGILQKVEKGIDKLQNIVVTSYNY